MGRPPSSSFGGSRTTALPSHHGLHNLIWEFTSSAAEGNHLDWYPGDDVVDMVGLDIYTDPASSMSGQWYDVLAHYNGRKMIALSESGTLPNATSMETYGIGWEYFSLWQDGFLDDFTRPTNANAFERRRHHHAERAANAALEQFGPSCRRL